jgi:hypothetical protein
MLWGAFCLTILCHNIARLGVGFGGVSTSKNPLMFQKLPGFQSCDDEYFFIRKSMFENRVLLNFDSQAVIKHCSMTVNASVLSSYEKLAPDNPFIRFSMGPVVKRVPLVDPLTKSTYIFTDFRFTVDGNSPSSFVVQPIASAELKLGSVFNINFYCNFVNFDEVPEESDSFALLVFGIALVFFVLTIVMMRWYLGKAPSLNVLQISDIWKMYNFNEVLIIVGSAGIQWAVCLAGYSLLHAVWENLSHTFHIWIIFTSFVSGSLIAVSQSVSGIRIHQKLLFDNWVAFSAGLWTFGNLMCIARNVNDSFCGCTAPRFAVIYVMLMLGRSAIAELSFAATRKIAISRGFSSSIFSFEFQRISDVFSAILSCIILKFIVGHLLQVLLDDFLFDWRLLGSLVFLYICCTAFFSMRKAVAEVAQISYRWQLGHVLYGLIGGVFCAIYVVFDVCFARGINFQSRESLIVCFGTMAVVVNCVMCVGIGVSYFMALLMVCWLTLDSREREGLGIE